MARPLIQVGTEVREMTAAEMDQWQTDNEEHAARRKAVSEAANARSSALSKLAALGLTDDEIAALLP